jgi:hypothetical protein
VEEVEEVEEEVEEEEEEVVVVVEEGGGGREGERASERGPKASFPADDRMEFYDVGTSDLRELWDSYLVESVSPRRFTPRQIPRPWRGIATGPTTATSTRAPQVRVALSLLHHEAHNSDLTIVSFKVEFKIEVVPR